MSAQIIDLCAARRLRDELAVLEGVSAALPSPSQQLTMTSTTVSSAPKVTIEGMEFTCVTWGGGSKSV